MSSHAFSSIVLRALIKQHGAYEGGLGRDGDDWAEAMMSKHHRAIEEQPVVYLTKEENSRAREYIAWHKEHLGWDVADEATVLFRDNHTAEIRKLFRTKNVKRPGQIEPDPIEDSYDSLPRDDGPPTCFKEWFAVNRVWRLTMAKIEISFQDAAFGTPGCCISRLPKFWEDRLDECMQITDANAIVPTPRGYGLPITRHQFDSVLPTSDHNASNMGMVTNAIIDPWFGILIAQRNQRKRNSTLFIQPDSLELVSATPQEIAEKARMVNADLEMILFPTVVFKGRDQFVLVVAFPKKRVLAVYDSLGPKWTNSLYKRFPWIKEKDRQSEDMSWEVRWFACPQQVGDFGNEDFMFINALLICSEKDPVGAYSQEDTLFFRRYIAAVVCMGELPEPVLKDSSPSAS